MKRPFAALDTSSIIESVAGGSRNQSMQLKLEETHQTTHKTGIKDKHEEATMKQNHGLLPIETLSILHLIFSSSLSDKIILL